MTDRLREAARDALQVMEQCGYLAQRWEAEQLRAALAEQDAAEPVAGGDHLRDDTEMIEDANDAEDHRLRIERLVRANARRAMVIDIIERLVEDPEREDFGPSDMEYWNPLHDALREKLRAALAEQDHSERDLDMVSPTVKDRLQVAAQAALDVWASGIGMHPRMGAALRELRAALAEQDHLRDATEMIGWLAWSDRLGYTFWESLENAEASTAEDFPVCPVYSRPIRREWQGLTEPDIHAAYDWPVGWGYDKVREFAFAIEAALREKNA